jgi:hypothetical protein
VVHAVIGNAGAGFTQSLMSPKPKIFTVAEFIHGYARLQATTQSMVFEAVNNNGRKVFDSVTFHKP